MGIKTEDMVKNLPPKELTTGVDWLGILDSFDPTILDERYINECARRNPYYTCYMWDTPPMPITERCFSVKTHAEFDRKELGNCVNKIANDGLTERTYKNARTALIKAIGSKGAKEYNRREYERLGETGRMIQAEEYKAWKAEWEKLREEIEYERAIASYYNWEPEPVSVHEKIVRVRKGVLASSGRPLTQRDFAKFIGYPINKYTEAEKMDWRRYDEEESEVEYELLEKLVMICHANPFWLFDPDCEAEFAEYYEDDAVAMGDVPCVFAAPDEILRWIEEGKPRVTRWEDNT